VPGRRSTTRRTAEALVAETDYCGHRLIVGRTTLTGPQPALLPTFGYHAVVTNRSGDAVFLDADHHRPAVVRAGEWGPQGERSTVASAV